MAGAEFEFLPGEKVLCFHGPLIYEAKCLKAEVRPNKNRNNEKMAMYRVHYNKWSTRWDEWVDNTRMLKDNDANRLKMKQLVEEHKRSATKTPSRKRPSVSSRDGTGIATTPTGGAGGKNKKSKMSVGPGEGGETFISPFEIAIPQILRLQLIDDRDFITNRQMVVPLPRELTVTGLLNNYYRRRKQQHRLVENQKTMVEFVHGLKVYFDVALGSLLLYRQERPQYVEALLKHKDTPTSELYGPEHLLRLFLRLPQMIARTSMDRKSIATLKACCLDVLAYMEEEYDSMFLKEYDNVTPEQLRVLHHG
eukprot:Clim_evm2s180 gene=Clim_evmTU2s180